MLFSQVYFFFKYVVGEAPFLYQLIYKQQVFVSFFSFVSFTHTLFPRLFYFPIHASNATHRKHFNRDSANIRVFVRFLFDHLLARVIHDRFFFTSDVVVLKATPIKRCLVNISKKFSPKRRSNNRPKF